MRDRRKHGGNKTAYVVFAGIMFKNDLDSKRRRRIRSIDKSPMDAPTNPDGIKMVPSVVWMSDTVDLMLSGRSPDDGGETL